MQSDQGLGMEMGVGAGGECSSSAAAAEQQLLKAEMAVHPLWEQLLGAHVGCLRVATPIDHLPLIDAQLAQSHHLVRSYAAGRRPLLSPHEKQELDSFLAQYLMVLCSFREQLQQHVRVHAVEAVIACREIEQSLQDLTESSQNNFFICSSFLTCELGVILEEGSGATMSDDEDELQMDCPLDISVEGHDMMGFGPLLPTESERSLMERVRQELKIELKQVDDPQSQVAFGCSEGKGPLLMGIMSMCSCRALGRESRMYEKR
ncbi:hypothetical protein BHE74_00058534 [Ensete ventricosum]|nr:hypothetical protein BHE74_00058534 [Ensete ventricosum]